MKALTVLLIALCVLSTFAIRPRKLSTSAKSRITEIRKGNSWGSILLNLAELSVMARGPLDELVTAIQDTIVDLQFKREKTDAAYVKRTEEHVALVQKLESDIANAEQDIADVTALLESLAEQKAALEEENSRLTKAIAATKESMEENTRIRAEQNAEYLTKVAEIEEAIATVEQCIDILYEFQNEPSMIQVKKAKTALIQTQQKVAKFHSNVEMSFLKSLVEVAMKQEFADASAVTAVITKFNEIKANLYDGSASLAADEEQQLNEYNKFIADSREYIMESEATIEYNNELLVENAANTVENKALLAQRIADKAMFEDELDTENADFQNATEIYEAWCVENDREVQICGEALETVGQVDFADYIGDRVNAEDGLVSSGMATAKPHGQGTEVFEFTYDQF